MFLFPIAETKVSSSIAGIMNSMMPIFTIIVGRCFGKRKPLLDRFRNLISFSGVVLLMISGEKVPETPIFYVGLLLFAAFSVCAVSVTTVGA